MNSAIHRKNIQEQTMFGSRYISDTSVHCMTISTTTWVTTSTMPERVYCETCSFTATPSGGTQYSAQPAVSGFDLIVPIGGGLDIELTVEPGVQNTFTFDVTQLSSNALTRFAVLEDSLGTLRELASELVTHRGGCVIKFTPTGNTVIFHVSNESLYNILVINIVEWYKSKTTTTQETILVEVCDEDKDRYRWGFNGQMKVNEWSGIGNFNEFSERGQDTRTTRFITYDPIAKKYPWNSPYAFAENRVIEGKDLEGLEYQSTRSLQYGIDNTAIMIPTEEYVQLQLSPPTFQYDPNKEPQLKQGGIQTTKEYIIGNANFENTMEYAVPGGSIGMKALKGEEITGVDVAWEVAGFIPLGKIAGKGGKLIWKGFQKVDLRWGNKVFENADEFKKTVSKLGGNPREKRALIESATRDVAKHNGWKKSKDLSGKLGDEVYEAGNDTYMSVDKYHGDFEVFKKSGSKYEHQGSIDIDGVQNKPRNSDYDKKL